MVLVGMEIMSRTVYLLASVAMASMAVFASGCSTLGLSLYPSGQFLTDEAETVLEATPAQPGQPRELAKTPLANHAIECGDVLTIEAIDLDSQLSLPADQLVAADGTVDLGEYGRVRLAGVSLEEGERLVEQHVRGQIIRRDALVGRVSHRQKSDPEALARRLNRLAVNVRLIEPVHRFYVLGEVNAPGSFPLAGHETVLDAIVSAGGLTSSADPCKIVLARPTHPGECRIALPICYREIVQLGNASTNYQIRPGDRIFVATRSCIDELMFWRATQACEKCRGCNQACCNAAATTTDNEFAGSPIGGILPGSLGFEVPESDAVDAASEPALMGEPVQQYQLPPASEESARPPNRSDRSNPQQPRSALDGQLDLPRLDQSGEAQQQPN